MKACPVELRHRIVAAVDRKVGSLPDVAALVQVSINCVANYLQLRAETGSLQPRPNPGGRSPAIPEARHDELRHLPAQQPDLTFDQLRDRLHLNCSWAAISRTLTKLGLTRKKTLVAAEQQRPDVQAARDAWADWQATLTDVGLDRLVFWDEAAVLTNMVLLHGRSLLGQCIRDYVTHGHWERLTMAAGLRLRGLAGALLYEGARRRKPARGSSVAAWGRACARGTL